jgi:tripartite-type tricarboxylate transporter receptor subunit TctC
MIIKLFKLLAVCIALSVATAGAQDVSNRPVKIITNLPVGASSEVLARKIADVLSVKLRTPVFVENRPGAGGLVALQAYLKEPADGYTIYLGDLGNFITMPILYKKEDLTQQMKTLAPVSTNYWAISTSGHIKTFQELKNVLDKGRSSYGSWGVGTSGHLCGAEMSQYFGADSVHVPYKEFGSWFSDLVSGTLTYSCTPIGSTLQYTKNNRLNWVAITADQRDPAYPDVPTVKELTGRQIVAHNGWIAFFINQKVPQARQQLLSEKIQETLKIVEIQEFIKSIASRPINMNNEQFDRYREIGRAHV